MIRTINSFIIPKWVNQAQNYDLFEHVNKMHIHIRLFDHLLYNNSHKFENDKIVLYTNKLNAYHKGYLDSHL